MSTLTGLLFTPTPDPEDDVKARSGLFVKLVNQDTSETVTSTTASVDGTFSVTRPSPGTYYVSTSPDGTTWTAIGTQEVAPANADIVHTAGNETASGVKTWSGDQYFGSGRPWVDVISYGADPTGTNDSTTAIQNAITGCAEGGTIFIPNGTYLVSSTITVTNEGVHIRGAGWTLATTKGTYLKWTGATGPVLKIGSSGFVRDVVVEDLAILGNSTSTQGIAIGPNAQCGTLRHVGLVGFSATGAAAVGNFGATGIYDWHLDHCRIQGNYDGINFSNGNAFTFVGCMVSSNANNGVHLAATYSFRFMGGDYEQNAASNFQLDGTTSTWISVYSETHTGTASATFIHCSLSGATINQGLHVSGSYAVSNGASSIVSLDSGSLIYGTFETNRFASSTICDINDAGSNSGVLIGNRPSSSGLINASSVGFINLQAAATGTSQLIQGGTVLGGTQGQNQIQIQGVAPGSIPQVSAVGADTNIGIRIQPKGTGSVTAAGNLTTTSTTPIIVGYKLNLSNFGTLQTASSLWSGTGVPSNSSGANGDFFFRSDGPPGGLVYFKASGAWTVITGSTLYSPSLTPTAVAANTTAEQTFTVTGLTVGQSVVVNGPSPTAGTGVVAHRVSATNTLAITFLNATSASLTPAAGTYTVRAT